MTQQATLLKELTHNQSEVVNEDALAFATHLHCLFNESRLALLEKRKQLQAQIDKGFVPSFLPETKDIRGGQWKVAKAPDDLNDRRVEITGPVDRKMMINALNSGAKVFMADIEDALSPTWQNIVEGQINLREAVRGSLAFTAVNGKKYQLNPERATLKVRPRGWHLEEKNVLVKGEPISASLFDFAIYFHNNAQHLLENGSGPYFYLPKLENHLEARLWNNVFVEAQKYMGLPQGSIRATVLIETILAALETEEILFELRDHISGLNAGRWDYIFSVIKRFKSQKEFILPDRSQVTMDVPFMKAYTTLLVQSCHLHGAHAIGGMAAFIPNRREPEVTKQAIASVTADKKREVIGGFDGTWVAHPDLVPVAQKVFDEYLGTQPHQKHMFNERVSVDAQELLSTKVQHGKITSAGVGSNISVAMQYIAYWLDGMGAVALNNLMEDAATAEISRAQLWQWLNNSVAIDDKQTLTKETYREIKKDIYLTLKKNHTTKNLDKAAEILDDLVLNPQFTEFLTIPSYKYLA